MKNNTQIQNISFLRIGASLPNVRKNDLWMQVLHLCQQKCHLAVVSEAGKRAAMKSCVCWAGHHPQMLTPLPLCQQLLSAKTCHLDCLCCLAAKIRWACINNRIRKSMLFSWIWSQMTLPYRGAAVSLVWKRHYTAASTRAAIPQETSDSRADSPSLGGSNVNSPQNHSPAAFGGCKLS